jgi:nitroreductase
MDVSEAVLLRKSIRGFLNTPVPNSVLRQLLKKAARAPSGGNLQPWKIFVINGTSMNKFLAHQASWNKSDSGAYDIYPPKLKEPYRTSRYEMGEEMYALLNIPRDDKDKRIEQVMKNFEFFGAPVGLFCYIDKDMGSPQWSDLGMFLQTFMLLAQESGLGTCAQEAWSMKQNSVTSFLKASSEDILFCGMALGYIDTDNPVNNLKTSRRPLNQWAYFVDK